MFIFGHLGLGSKLAEPWSKGLPRRALLLGTLLPDLIDKPIYYSLVFATGKHGAELGMFAGTRLFGHTALFVGGILALAKTRHSKWLAALGLGAATHLVLDNLLDTLLADGGHSAFLAMTWPLHGFEFPPIPYSGLGEHARRLLDPRIWSWELAGFAVLCWDEWKIRNSKQITGAVKSGRRRFSFRLRG